eukprot:9503059-Alexandrium_andersonii.AAC.1
MTSVSVKLMTIVIRRLPGGTSRQTSPRSASCASTGLFRRQVRHLSEARRKLHPSRAWRINV